MDNSTPPTFDPNALTFRNYVDAASSSNQSIPSYQELMVLQQELQHLSEKAGARLERYNSELVKLEGATANSVPSKDSSVSSTPTSTTSNSAALFNPTSQGLSSSATAASTSGRASVSPINSSPSSFSGGTRAPGASGTPASGTATGSSTKPGVVTLKLKRSDAPESAKTDDEQSVSSTPNTIKIRTGTPSSQDGVMKKRKKRDLDEDSEYSEDERATHSKAKRSEDYPTKAGRSTSPQPVKPNTNRNNTPKSAQHKTGDKAHSGAQQKKKKNEHHTEKTQKPPPKVQEVQEDFSKVKVANQIPIQTFWTSMEPFFRQFTEADRGVLEEEGDQVTPLLIPPLGKHYLDVWAEEERSLMPFDGYNSRRNSVDSTKDITPSRNSVSSVPFELTEDNIDQDEVSCGPLTERIICSLISEEVDPKLVKQDDEPTSQPAIAQSHPRNYAELEERVKRELRYIGLLGNEEIDWDAREDDEISIQLRSLQKELREVMKVNKSRKQKLLGLVNNHLAFQEYNTILDDLDKQVEQGYLKRFRMTKSKKKKTSTPKSLSENALSAMDRRRRFVQGVGPIFPAESYTIPSTSIYEEELQPKSSSTIQTYRQLNGLP